MKISVLLSFFMLMVVSCGKKEKPASEPDKGQAPAEIKSEPVDEKSEKPPREDPPEKQEPAEETGDVKMTDSEDTRDATALKEQEKGLTDKITPPSVKSPPAMPSSGPSLKPPSPLPADPGAIGSGPKKDRLKRTPVESQNKATGYHDMDSDEHTQE